MLSSTDPTGIDLKRSASGLVNKPQVFTATVLPLNVTFPLTVTWQADGQTSATFNDTITTTQSYVWMTPGTRIITVTAQNDNTSVTVTRTVVISDNFSLTILHTNDVHARLLPYAPSGSSNCVDNPNSSSVCIAGMGRISTKVKEIRQAEDNVVLLDAGDQFQGTLFYNLYKGEPTALVMNAIGYDAMAAGNHEFDNGPTVLRQFIDQINFPLLSANIDVSSEPSLTGKISPTVVLTVNGEAVGVVGLTTPDTAFIASPGPNVGFNSPVTSAQAAINALLAQGVNRIIVLSHLGYSVDLQLAAQITGADVIVGGHSHTFLRTPPSPIVVAPGATDTPAGPYPTVVTNPDGKPVLVVQAFQWGRYLGNLKATFNITGDLVSWSGNPIFMTNTIAVDPMVTNILSPTYTGGVTALQNQVVGTTTVDMPLLVGSVQVCRRVECLLGNLVSDAMLWKINSNLPVTQHYQIALQNGGGLRAPITALTVTVGEILEVLPFGNTIATLEITGSQIISALENGLANVGLSGDGRFPQVSGLRYLWDIYRPVGSRVISVEVYSPTLMAYVPLSPSVVYRVATNNFMRNGGDGYTVLRDFAINPYDFGPSLDEAVKEYFQQFSPVTPTIDGRIHYLRRSHITATRTTLLADGVSTARITVTVRNTVLSPISGTAVSFATSAGTLSAPSATTNSSGQAVITLTAPITAGTAIVTATADGEPLPLTFTFLETITASPRTLPADGVSTARITVTLRNPNTLAPLSGVTVTFLSNAGTLSSSAAQTDANGQVVITLTAPLDPGQATVFAIGAGQTLSITFNFTQSAATVNFTPSVITQSVGSGAAPAGSIVTYTFTFTNAGPGNAQGVLIVSPIPSGTEYVSGSASGGFGPSSAQALGIQSLLGGQAANSVVFWQGNIPAGQSHTLSYAVKVKTLFGPITATATAFLNNTQVGQLSISTPVSAQRVYLPIVRH
ncbi:MAG: 5'-nucleotidase C-terminal domain-containing protein [Anaerolineae bacterium]|nr:5'-nucleotidase C-terminal domain-containing protein [Anaerolineae bacterium]